MIRMVHIYLFAGLFSIFSCNYIKSENENLSNGVLENLQKTESDGSEKLSHSPINKNTPYFRATGTEPFWSLEINRETVIFKTPSDSIKFPYLNPALAQDSNVKRYALETEA